MLRELVHEDLVGRLQSLGFLPRRLQHSRGFGNQFHVADARLSGFLFFFFHLGHAFVQRLDCLREVLGEFNGPGSRVVEIFLQAFDLCGEGSKSHRGVYRVSGEDYTGDKHQDEKAVGFLFRSHLADRFEESLITGQSSLRRKRCGEGLAGLPVGKSQSN